MMLRTSSRPSVLLRVARIAKERLRRRLPPGQHLVDIDGIKIKLDAGTPFHQHIYQTGSCEPELTALITAISRPEDIFVDIGANVGWHSFALLTQRPDVHCAYAFEPSGAAFEMLTEGVAANGLQKRCVAQRVALGNCHGEATVHTPEGFGSAHASLFPLADYDSARESVAVDTLDAAAASFAGPPNIIKCDVEGGERDVLLGASAILRGERAAPPIWLLEANYETSGMAGFFPYDLIEIARAQAPYDAYTIRDSRLARVKHKTALRHGDTLVLAIPDARAERLTAILEND